MVLMDFSKTNDVIALGKSREARVSFPGELGASKGSNKPSRITKKKNAVIKNMDARFPLQSCSLYFWRLKSIASPKVFLAQALTFVCQPFCETLAVNVSYRMLNATTALRSGAEIEWSARGGSTSKKNRNYNCDHDIPLSWHKNSSHHGRCCYSSGYRLFLHDRRLVL